MAKITQPEFFGWEEIENLGDLERLKLVIDTIPDEQLMQMLEKIRGKGRDDYPVRSMWNSVLAGVVFEHISIESLRRELKRNAQLRKLCGFSVFAIVPSSSAYSRFLLSLIKHQNELDQMFNSLVEELMKLLPDYGKDLAIDGKILRSLAKKQGSQKGDKRGEHDADWGRKNQKGKHKDGTTWEKMTKWFGYRLHLISDAKYELPVHFEVTKASCSEVKVGKKLIKELNSKNPSLIERCEHLMADKGYDSTDLIGELWIKYQIKPVIDIRKMWKDKEESRVVQDPKFGNICYDQKGTITCHCPKTGEVKEMVHKGFEKKRDALKYQCPLKAYGISCKGAKQCPVKDSIRIPRSMDERIFTPVARSSYKWERLYKMRTSIERINGRIDVSFGFERHFIRGLEKMKFKMGLALTIMLTLAVGRIRSKQTHMMRSLVKAA